MATSAHTEHPGGGKPQFPPFNKETFASQLVWFAIFFVALYVLIGAARDPADRRDHRGARAAASTATSPRPTGSRSSPTPR